ncbi:hypothetical protein SAMD00019534_002980 [Acytostelium subglobosum LB1]|uniref:hypothetical protein n=1 Tax=Acytostelium subglobosum LB1 TaxID=1410327 RepID=UPI0006451B54|nr:hypothetical protein SAMD00019534_002980 [Acytostelium subglobosum LB1]GAM17123.1 hypothetical protein SAMD00019534_002980 [Acytostelium subglobosum LB1]|eukprot:XP_012759185.1 hypothetical protein SAMD00019534_002980 [Acytostelium subglobosum LB1]
MSELLTGNTPQQYYQGRVNPNILSNEWQRKFEESSTSLSSPPRVPKENELIKHSPIPEPRAKPLAKRSGEVVVSRRRTRNKYALPEPPLPPSGRLGSDVPVQSMKPSSIRIVNQPNTFSLENGAPGPFVVQVNGGVLQKQIILGRRARRRPLREHYLQLSIVGNEGIRIPDHYSFRYLDIGGRATVALSLSLDPGVALTPFRVIVDVFYRGVPVCGCTCVSDSIQWTL